MEYVPYVGFGKYRRTTVKINLYFKRIMIKQMICIYKKKKVATFHPWKPFDQFLSLSHVTQLKYIFNVLLTTSICSSVCG